MIPAPSHSPPPPPKPTYEDHVYYEYFGGDTNRDSTYSDQSSTGSISDNDAKPGPLPPTRPAPLPPSKPPLGSPIYKQTTFEKEEREPQKTDSIISQESLFDATNRTTQNVAGKYKVCLKESCEHEIKLKAENSFMFLQKL